MTKTALALADEGPTKARTVVVASTEPDVVLLLRVNLEFEGFKVIEAPWRVGVASLIPVDPEAEHPVMVLDADLVEGRDGLDPMLDDAGIAWHRVIELAKEPFTLPQVALAIRKPFSPLQLGEDVRRVANQPPAK